MYFNTQHLCKLREKGANNKPVVKEFSLDLICSTNMFWIFFLENQVMHFSDLIFQQPQHDVVCGDKRAEPVSTSVTAAGQQGVSSKRNGEDCVFHWHMHDQCKSGDSLCETSLKGPGETHVMQHVSIPFWFKLAQICVEYVLIYILFGKYFFRYFFSYIQSSLLVTT